MGYSTSVACKSINARDELSFFLRKHLVPWHKLTAGTHLELDPAWDYTQFVRMGKELSYGASNSRVGFNFSTQSEPGPYMWSILKWAALKVGRKTKLSVGDSAARVPYVTYDGHDHIPVLLQSEYENTAVNKFALVDEHGCPPLLYFIKQNKSFIMGSKYYRYWLIKNAMMELDKKWQMR